MNNQFQSAGRPAQTNINLKLDDLTDIKCNECESEYFRPAMLMKRLSPLVSPTGNEQIVPIQIFRCDDCGHVNEVFIPK